MKRCSCEHWQICPTCYPQGFDEHGVRKPVEVPPSREELQRQAVALREQVEKLTKERDDLRSRRCEVCGYLEHEREHTGCLREQLAALAEQNAKLREVLVDCEQALDECRDYPITYDSVIEALSLPDLASPVLNRIRAEGMREAEKIVRKRVQWVSNGQGIQYRSTAPESISAESLADEIRARADELEKTNG